MKDDVGTNLMVIWRFHIIFEIGCVVLMTSKTIPDNRMLASTPIF